MSNLIYREGAKDYARHAMAKGLNVLEYLDEVPAADFWPVVRHGRWIYMKDCESWFCSNCKNIFMLLEGTPKDNDYNYCPNCGAKMESEVK